MPDSHRLQADRAIARLSGRTKWIGRGPEVADVFRRYGGHAYRERHGESLSTAQRRSAMTAIEICRTAALGAPCRAVRHLRSSAYLGTAVAETGTARSANHWPALSGWMTAVPRSLDTQYFHVVFTLRAELAAIALQNKAVVYGILFRTVAGDFCGRSPPTRSILVWRSASSPFSTRGGPICYTIRIFTWSCSGGGLSPDGKPGWISCRSGYFLPVQVLSRLFRR